MKMTPMLRQYLDLKEQAGSALLLYRMGDFYELFFEDAQQAAPVLGITLTRRRQNDSVDAPMCGVPHHAFDGYLGKLLDAGFRVAVAEQVEDPAKAKGLVRREIIRTHTPGTISATELLEGIRTLLSGRLRQRPGILGPGVDRGQYRHLRRPAEQRSGDLDRTPRATPTARSSGRRGLGRMATGVARRNPTADGHSRSARDIFAVRRRTTACVGCSGSGPFAVSASIPANPWWAWPAPCSGMSKAPRRAPSTIFASSSAVTAVKRWSSIGRAFAISKWIVGRTDHAKVR